MQSRELTGRDREPEPSVAEEEELRAAVRSLGSVLDNTADAVFITDLSGKPLFQNRAAERMVGPPPGEPSPDDWSSAYGLYLTDRATLYPANELPLVRALRGESVVGIEIYVRNQRVPDGVWISVNATPWLDSAGRRQGAIATFRDVTESRKSDETVQRLSNAVEQTADSVVITDENGVILYVNPAFEECTGYSRAEALGRTPRLLKSGRQDAKFYEEMWTTLLAGGVFRGTVVNRRKSGELYYAEQTITPMKDGSGRIRSFVSVGKDVTELRKGAERDIELQMASRVQQKLYPRSVPLFPGIDIAGAAHPSTTMCGDYFDYIGLSRERLGIVVGDVSGHGFGPALIMTETRACVRSLLPRTADLDEVLQAIDRILTDDLESGYSVTLLLASLDVRELTLTYANAGHPPGYVLDGSGKVRSTLEATRIPLGLPVEPHKMPMKVIPLEAGCILVFLTDGILETNGPDGCQFGVENALAVVSRHREESAQQILDHLFEAVEAFAPDEPRSDDQTAMICKIGQTR